MPAPQQLLDLVDRFDRNLDAYRSGKYNETQVRREFIDPFLKLLGWDVDNMKGYAEQYKEVVHEDAIKVGTSTKAPDYSLRIGGQRKLFVEAKKPSVNIKQDIAPAFQVRRYAWSAKLPLSILTDFEEFAVYDCRNKPDKNDKASHARIMYLTFSEYAEKWDELVSLFAPESIMQGAFDKFVSSSKKKRGTAEVDDAFLAEISVWRDDLARNIALRNSGITTRQLNHAVQRTIDRLIFLRIAEDRGIETYGRLRERAQSKEIYNNLGKLFQQADAKYNSGLFHFKAERGRSNESLDTFTLGLTIDDKVLKSIIKRLYYPDSPYQFDVIPADILGQVYEQFLGKVIRLTAGGQARVEEKPEVKKAGGVFYTPTYIVDYIVLNTVGKLLEGKKLGKSIKNKQYIEVSELRILDPACGSGSFLIGAYQFLLDWHLNEYLENVEAWSQKTKPPIYQNQRGEWRLTIGERKRILLNNIYGVDIDAQAVEVTKLSLLLKVMEGETEQTLGTQMKLLPERVLPNLSANIQCGNSLIGPDFYQGQMSLGILDEEEMYRVNVFDWSAAFPNIVPWGGFDAVIGNPPYGALLAEQDSHYIKKYYSVSEYQIDTYSIFIEKAQTLIKTNGLLGYIIPSAWVASKFDKRLRHFLLSKYTLHKIVIAPKNVFINATVETVILISQNTYHDQNDFVVERWDKDNQSSYILHTESILSNPELIFPIYNPPEFERIADKLRRYKNPLSMYAEVVWGVKIYQRGKGEPKQTGIESKEKRFHSELKIKKSHKPLLGGKEIKRYSLKWRGGFIDYGKWLAEPRSSDWFTGERILIREVTNKGMINATIVDHDCVFSNSVDGVRIKDNSIKVEFLLGLINSKLISFYHLVSSANAFKGAFPKVLIKDILNFPLPPPPWDKFIYQKFSTFVKRILELHKSLEIALTTQERTMLQRQIDAIDRQIDQLVYQLYDLTPEEIAIVETAVS